LADGYKVTGAYLSMSEADQAVLDQIAQRGDDLSQPRHTLLFFYKLKSAGSPCFGLIADAAKNHGLTVCVVDEETLTLERQCYVDPERLKPLIDWATEIAAEANADFDGWECAVIARKN
jgi:hypothetical protein